MGPLGTGLREALAGRRFDGLRWIQDFFFPYEMHIPPQICGDCGTFVSAEPLFSKRFMMVAGSWKEPV